MMRQLTQGRIAHHGCKLAYSGVHLVGERMQLICITQQASLDVIRDILKTGILQVRSDV